MYSRDLNDVNICILNFYQFFTQMVGYLHTWYYGEQVKVHFYDVSNIQIPTVH